MKFIKENFDRSIDLERRITDYKLKHLNESVEEKNKKQLNEMGPVAAAIISGVARSVADKVLGESEETPIEESKKDLYFEVEYKQAGATKIDSDIKAEDVSDAMKQFALKHLKDEDPIEKIISCEYVENIVIDEDVKKLPNGKWANVGKDGKANSGEFITKKEAEAQRKAMYANGYKGESLEESVNEPFIEEYKYTIWIFDKDSKNWESWGKTDKPYIHPEIAAAFGERVKVLPLGKSPKLEEDVEIEIETKDEPKIEVEDSDEHSIENVPEMPTNDCKMVVANLINPLIKDELDAIDGYNSAVATFRSMMEDETTDKSIDYEGIIAVISEITNEENLHIGQLEKLLETVSPNAKSINDGKDEAAEQLEETSDKEEVDIEEKTEEEVKE